MKVSSKKTVLTAAVLVTLSSSTGLAATQGTVDSQELFHANRLVTDPPYKPAMEENAVEDRYEASISARKKSPATVQTAPAPVPAKKTRPARLRWESVDARLAARNADPSFSLSVQKAKPVIITAEDVKREEKLAAKEGRPVQELVGDVNMNRPQPPAPQKKPASEAYASATADDANTPSAAPEQQVFVRESAVSDGRNTIPSAVERPQPVSMPSVPAYVVQPNTSSEYLEKRPSRPRIPQLPPATFSLTHPAENGAAPKPPEHFAALDSAVTSHQIAEPVSDRIPAAEHSVRPNGVPDITSRPRPQSTEEDVMGLSDEVRRHILAGQLAMEVQLQRDPSVAGMRAITKVLRENTTLTRMQKIDFLIGFGRALHQSGLPRQQQALLIKTIAEAF